MGWMPDGKAVVVLRALERRDGAAAKMELWRVPFDGSAPVFTGIAAPGPARRDGASWRGGDGVRLRHARLADVGDGGDSLTLNA